MFAIIYKFKVKNDKQAEFVKSWRELTALIYEYEGSLGSRLHKQPNGDYIAYAQWPNKEVWKNSGNNLPEKAIELRKEMRVSCSNIEILFELDCIEDRIQDKTYVQKK